MVQNVAQLACRGQLSLLAARLEAKCTAEAGWVDDDHDDALFTNYVALYALHAAGRVDTPAAKAGADRLKGMRRTNGLWRVQLHTTEPTSRAAAALLMSGQATPDDLAQPIAHIREAQLPDGGWPLGGTHAPINQKGEVGPSLPSVLALRHAQQQHPEPLVAQALTRASEFFLAQMQRMEPQIGQDGRVELAFVWAVRGYLTALLDKPTPEVSAPLTLSVLRIIDRVAQGNFANDDAQLQLLFNAVHALGLLDGAAVKHLPQNQESLLSLMVSWTLLAEPRSRTGTRLVAGSLLAGAVLAKATDPTLQMVPGAMPLTAAASPVEPILRRVDDGADGYYGAVWSEFWSRPAKDQVTVAFKFVSAFLLCLSPAFYVGTIYATKASEQTERVARRLIGDLEILVKKESNGLPAPSVRVELVPVLKRVHGTSDAQGKVRLVWNLLEPDVDSLRFELHAQGNTSPSPQGVTKKLGDGGSKTVEVYVP